MEFVLPKGTYRIMACGETGVCKQIEFPELNQETVFVNVSQSDDLQQNTEALGLPTLNEARAKLDGNQVIKNTCADCEEMKKLGIPTLEDIRRKI